jgi:AcrR family transcriptional regulator
MIEPLDTKQKILDAAESLFANEGYHCTSLRAITGKAGVNLAAVNYHFGSKEALLDAVFERRLVPLNEVRMKRISDVLEAARKEGRRPLVADVLRAFVEPTLRFKSEPGREDFFALVGRSFSDPTGETTRKAFFRFISPVIQYLFESLREALPELPADVFIWRFHFALGSFVHLMHACMRAVDNSIHACNMDSMPEFLNLPGTDDTEIMMDMLIRFMTAGLEAS